MTTFWHSWIAREHIFTIFRGSNNPYQGHGRAKRCVLPLLTTRTAIMYRRVQCPYRMILLSRRPLSIQVLLVSWWWFSWRWRSKILLLSGFGVQPWGSMELRLVDVVFNLFHFTICTTNIVGSRQHGVPLASNFQNTSSSIKYVLGHPRIRHIPWYSSQPECIKLGLWR